MDEISEHEPGLLKQGSHADPTDPSTPPPDRSDWSAVELRAWESPAMELFRAGLRPADGGSIREGILDDLASYHEMTPEQAVQRCIDWEAWSVEEWQAAPRDTPQALTDFYRGLQSWSFDLLWYAYLQAEGYGNHTSVTIANDVPWSGAGRNHLDFGSGIGATAQLFSRLGFESDMADISTSLLRFAGYRLERRDERAGRIDLNDATLPVGRYDVITAIDTLAHVPDLPATATLLHRSMKPGGLLYTNFDVRPMTPENAWHLYDDALPLRFQLQRAGFEPEAAVDDTITRYRHVPTTGVSHRARLVRDTVTLRSPVYRIARATAGRIVRRVKG